MDLGRCARCGQTLKRALIGFVCGCSIIFASHGNPHPNQERYPFPDLNRRPVVLSTSTAASTGIAGLGPWTKYKEPGAST